MGYKGNCLFAGKQFFPIENGQIFKLTRRPRRNSKLISLVFSLSEFSEGKIKQRIISRRTRWFASLCRAGERFEDNCEIFVTRRKFSKEKRTRGSWAMLGWSILLCPKKRGETSKLCTVLNDTGSKAHLLTDKVCCEFSNSSKIITECNTLKILFRLFS